MHNHVGNAVHISPTSRGLLMLGLILVIICTQLSASYALTMGAFTMLILSLLAYRGFGFPSVTAILFPVSTGPSTTATIYLNKLSYKELGL